MVDGVDLYKWFTWTGTATKKTTTPKNPKIDRNHGPAMRFPLVLALPSSQIQMAGNFILLGLGRQ